MGLTRTDDREFTEDELAGEAERGYRRTLERLQDEFVPGKTHIVTYRDIVGEKKIFVGPDLNKSRFGSGGQKYIIILDNLKAPDGVYLGAVCPTCKVCPLDKDCPSSTPQYVGMGISYVCLCIAIMVIIYLLIKTRI
jgi:hypothetical protein